MLITGIVNHYLIATVCDLSHNLQNICGVGRNKPAPAGVSGKGADIDCNCAFCAGNARPKIFL